MNRTDAFTQLDTAAKALESTRARSKAVCEDAGELERRAREMRETSAAAIDRALLDYATAHAQLTKLITLDTWDERRAAELLKSAQTMKGLVAK